MRLTAGGAGTDPARVQVRGDLSGGEVTESTGCVCKLQMTQMSERSAFCPLLRGHNVNRKSSFQRLADDKCIA